MDLGATAVARHPPDDRLAHAAAVGPGGGVAEPAGAVAGAAGAGWATVAGAGGVPGAGSRVVCGRPPPSHWRHNSAPPAATSTSGQTITSENRSPKARNVSRTLSARNAIPIAISIVPRLVRSHVGAAGASPAGMKTQASREIAMPTPPAVAPAPNATRTMIGSTP